MTMTVHPSLQGGPLARGALGTLPLEAAFPAEEYRRRLDAARAALAGAGMGGLVVSNPAHVLHLSGYQTFSVLGGETLIVPAEGDPALVVPAPELGTALLHSWLERAWGFDPERSGGAYLGERLREAGLGNATIGVEMDASGPDSAVSRRAAGGASRCPLRRRHLARRGAESAEVRARARLPPPCGRDDRRGHEGGDGGGGGRRQRQRGGRGGGAGDAERGQRVHVRGADRHHRRALGHSALEPQAQGRFAAATACASRSAPATSATPLRSCAPRASGPPTPGVQRLADACLRALDCVLEALRPGLTGHEVAEAGWRGIAAAGEELVFHGCFGYGVGAGFPPTWADRTGAHHERPAHAHPPRHGLPPPRRPAPPRRARGHVQRDQRGDRNGLRALRATPNAASSSAVEHLTAPRHESKGELREQHDADSRGVGGRLGRRAPSLPSRCGHRVCRRRHHLRRQGLRRPRGRGDRRAGTAW